MRSLAKKTWDQICWKTWQPSLGLSRLVTWARNLFFNFLTIFLEHGIMAHIPWWLDQWKLSSALSRSINGVVYNDIYYLKLKQINSKELSGSSRCFLLRYHLAYGSISSEKSSELLEKNVSVLFSAFDYSHDNSHFSPMLR